MRRGQIDESLKWIFVILIGIFILGFFINLVFKNVETSQNQNEILIKNSLNSFIKNTKLSQNIENKVFLSDDIKFKLNFNKIEFENNDLDISNTVLYGEDEFESNNFFLSSYPFEIPYRVNNNLFLFDMNKKYIIFYNLNDRDIKRLNNTLIPEFLNARFIRWSSIPNELNTNLDAINDIYFDDDVAVYFIASADYNNNINTIKTVAKRAIKTRSWKNNDLDKMNFKLFTSLKFSSEDNSFGSVKVHFLGKTSENDKVITINDKSLFYGALAVDNFDSYLEQSSKLLESTKRITQIQLHKVTSIINLHKPEYGFCTGSYLDIDSALSSLINDIDSMTPNLLNKYSNSQIGNFLQKVFEVKTKLKETNFRLRIGINSCPEIR